MPRIRYLVAMSLDGYIAGPKGEADWIIMDPDIDFEGLFAQFDTFLMGRRTFEAAGAGGGSASSDAKTFVFSRTLRPQDHPRVTIVSEVSAATVASVREQAVKDIWLFGGGTLFQSFLDAGLVDTVEREGPQFSDSLLRWLRAVEDGRRSHEEATEVCA